MKYAVRWAVRNGHVQNDTWVQDGPDTIMRGTLVAVATEFDVVKGVVVQGNSIFTLSLDDIVISRDLES